MLLLHAIAILMAVDGVGKKRCGEDGGVCSTTDRRHRPTLMAKEVMCSCSNILACGFSVTVFRTLITKADSMANCHNGTIRPA
jgi:hypothetical protein